MKVNIDWKHALFVHMLSIESYSLHEYIDKCREEKIF